MQHYWSGTLRNQAWGSRSPADVGDHSLIWRGWGVHDAHQIPQVKLELRASP